MRRKYPSDVSDVRWRMIEPLISGACRRRGRKPTTNLREVVNALNYRWTTGCPWRMLPHDFPAWETVYTYFRRWQRQGQLLPLREILLRKSPYVPLDEQTLVRVLPQRQMRESTRHTTGIDRSA